MKLKTPQITVTEPEIKLELTVFASLLPVVTGIAARKNNVSRQPSNSGRRERAFKGPRGIQAPDRREVRHAILHHLARWEGCSSVSLRGMAADRGKAGAVVKFQPDQKEVPEPHQLLRPVGGDRRPGAAADTGAAPGLGEGAGRSGRGRQSDLPRSAEPRGVPEGHRREPIHV